MDKITIRESSIQGPYVGKAITKEELIRATQQHQEDVHKGLNFFVIKILKTAMLHDHTKIERMDAFHEDVTSGFKTNKWLSGHLKDERHHLLRHVPDDVDLIDVLEFLVDGVMAGLARSGHYDPREIPNDLLQKAFKNTVTKLVDIVEVEYARVHNNN